MNRSLLLLLATTIAFCAAAADAPADRYTLPSTISPEAAAALQPVYDALKAERAKPEPPRPVTLADFEKRREPGEKAAAENFGKQAESLGVRATEEQIDGIPVVRIRPNKQKSGKRSLVYLHGGAYVMGSARSTLFIPSKLATATGCEVISIDYTLAPAAKWQQATGEVVRVWKALLAGGAKPASTGMFGDSAGGGLLAGSVLRMRDEKLPLPGALYLMSPWADITMAGDTPQTLAQWDPLVPVQDAGWVAANYADVADQKHPYVSAVYGDFSKPYPPTLIQAGTREVLLSAAVRLYQAMKGGGRDVILDVYEGMPHVFQGFVADSPEGVTATRRAAAFFDSHLKP